MEYRRMGRTGLKVSEVCLGTMTFGHSTDEREAKRIVDLAFDAGITTSSTRLIRMAAASPRSSPARRSRAVAAMRSSPLSSSTPWVLVLTTRGCRGCAL